MSEIESEHIAIRFVNEINRHDLTTLTSLMAPDFRYIDPHGVETRGRERACAAWTAYFEAHPEYRIAIREHMASGTVVALFGSESGTSRGPERGRRGPVPAAWRAVIADGRVAEWKVYGGAEPGQEAAGPSAAAEGGTG